MPLRVGVCVFTWEKGKKVLKCDNWRSHPKHLSYTFITHHVPSYTHTRFRLSVSDSLSCSHKELAECVCSACVASGACTQTHNVHTQTGRKHVTGKSQSVEYIRQELQLSLSHVKRFAHTHTHTHTRKKPFF